MKKLLSSAVSLLCLVACGPSMPPPEVHTTWYKDVLPITRDRCQGCHQAGGIAPFSMEKYSDVKPMNVAMAADVQAGVMPPWKPAASCGQPFLNDRHLSQEQIDTIQKWSDEGALEGDPADAPPVSNANTGALEWVDQTVSAAAPYTPDMSLGSDDYHCTLIDPQLSADKFVVGYQVLPDQRAEVHHVILFAVNRAKAQAKDQNGKGWTCFGDSNVDDDKAIFVGGWAPGEGAVEFPSGTGIDIPQDDVFVMQVHYNFSNGVDAPDHTQVQLQYSNRTVTSAIVAPIVDSDFNVPPGAMGYTPSYEPSQFPNSFGVPVKIWGVFPHMHTHGTHIRVDGPDGCLIDVPNWDFHWQQMYFFKGNVTVADGQKVSLTCTWDNPTSKALQWGESTSDEMCLAFLYMTF